MEDEHLTTLARSWRVQQSENVGQHVIQPVRSCNLVERCPDKLSPHN